jgi:tRNA-intron endonuclease
LSKKLEEVAVADLVGDRAIVWDSKHGMQLYGNGYFGQPVGIRKPKSAEFETPLELSLLEAAYLTKIGALRVNVATKKRPLTMDKIVEIGSTFADEFLDRFLVYSHLREQGYIVRPGLKFGTDFAVYRKGPGKDHAPFMVHVISGSKGLVPLDIVRAGRLATSVKKKFIIATIKENAAIAYYSFIWHRP